MGTDDKLCTVNILINSPRVPGYHGIRGSGSTPRSSSPFCYQMVSKLPLPASLAAPGPELDPTQTKNGTTQKPRQSIKSAGTAALIRRRYQNNVLSIHIQPFSGVTARHFMHVAVGSRGKLMHLQNITLETAKFLSKAYSLQISWQCACARYSIPRKIINWK